MCHMSCVTCHVSPVTCHMSHVTCICFGQKVGASQWSVCYQRGLPRLVLKHNWSLTFSLPLKLCRSGLGCSHSTCTLLYWTDRYCTALHYNELQCTALHCTALHWTSLHCTHCTPQESGRGSGVLIFLLNFFCQNSLSCPQPYRGAGCPYKWLLDGAADFLSTIWQHITTVSSV